MIALAVVLYLTSVALMLAVLFFVEELPWMPEGDLYAWFALALPPIGAIAALRFLWLERAKLAAPRCYECGERLRPERAYRLADGTHACFSHRGEVR